MTRRTSIVEAVGAYFASKGKILTADEYKNAEDAPIRFQLIKRNIGSWSRLINMVGDISQYGDTVVSPAAEPTKAALEVKPVVEKTKGA